MKKIKKCIICCLYILKLSSLLRFLFQRKNVTIILYHDVLPEIFKKHVKEIKKRYTLINSVQFQYYMENENINLPIYPLLITFDDGHKGNFKLLEIFIEEKIRPLIFLTTGVVCSNRTFWFNNVDNSNKKKLKKLDNTKRMQLLNSYFSNENGKVGEGLSINEIKMMKKYVDFASHTVSHPCLNQCTSSEIIYELEKSKLFLKEQLNILTNSLAYPNGDFNDKVLENMNKVGYHYGFSLIPGINNKKTNPLLLRRFSVSDNVSVKEMLVKVSGLWWYLKKRR